MRGLHVPRGLPFVLPYLPFLDTPAALSAMTQSAQTDGLLVI